MPEAVSTSLVGSGRSGRVGVEVAAGSDLNAVFCDLSMVVVRRELIGTRAGVGMIVHPTAHAVSNFQHPRTTRGDSKAL